MRSKHCFTRFIKLYLHDRMVLFDYNYYGLPDRNTGSEDLEMQHGEEKFVPEFVDASTHDLEGRVEVESDDAVNSAIMMVITYRKSEAKRMGTTATKVRTTLAYLRGGRHSRSNTRVLERAQLQAEVGDIQFSFPVEKSRLVLALAFVGKFAFFSRFV